MDHIRPVVSANTDRLKMPEEASDSQLANAVNIVTDSPPKSIGLQLAIGISLLGVIIARKTTHSYPPHLLRYTCPEEKELSTVATYVQREIAGLTC